MCPESCWGKFLRQRTKQLEKAVTSLTCAVLMRQKMSYFPQAVACAFQFSLSTEAVDKNVGKTLATDCSKPLAQAFRFMLATETYTRVI
jgi:hypothetical protein